MVGKEAARKIDISAVRTHHSKKDIDVLVESAKQYRFINVHVLPCWVSYVADLLKDDDDILPGAPVGFPDGAHKKLVKVLEAKELVADRVGEMDLVMNVGRFKNQEYDFVLDEIKEIRDIAGSLPLKVILEINCLTDDEIKKACDIVIEAGADFVKTGTGWVKGDANIDRLKMIKMHVGNQIKIKAAGGIRTVEEFLSLNEMGVERFGINLTTAIELVEYFDGAK
jgi:deoxyribose-phosphate aldolase